jgi:predicted ATPase
MPMHMLKRLDLKGYKSIKDVSLELRPLNVLIGANGSGKSNLVSFFNLLTHMKVAGEFQRFIAISGGANSLLHYGAKLTREIDATLFCTINDSSCKYDIRLGLTAEDMLVLEEHVPFDLRDPILDNCRVFQFHDTSSTSNFRLNGDINRNRSLEGDGGNLAAVLYKIQQTEPECYQRIVGTIRQIAPFFGDFNLAPSALNTNVIQLRWTERDRDYDFGPHLLSDGTLRAMALVTLLLQPIKDRPSLIIIDEPELGLHPSAIATLAGLLRSASEHSQIIVATESATLLDHFEPHDVVVTERCMGETVFKRLDSKDLQEWREDYCLSELWQKNVFGGEPSR